LAAPFTTLFLNETFTPFLQLTFITGSGFVSRYDIMSQQPPEGGERSELMSRNGMRAIIIAIVAISALFFAACAKPKAQLSVSKSEIHSGESVSVNWQTTNAKQVLLNGKEVAKTGTEVLQPTETTTYELVGKRGDKSAKDSKIVKVEVVA